MSKLLEIQNISCQKGNKSILQSISVNLDEGQILAVIGPNGAGKSTLLKCILGLEPYKGIIETHGMNLTNLSIEERAKLLSFVPQQTLLMSPLTVRQVVEQGRFAHQSNKLFPTSPNKTVIDHALKAAQITHFQDRLFTKLSQGEKQKVLLARAMATEAKILLLDEPTASLDIGYALELFAQLKKLTQQGTAIIVVLHCIQDALDWADQALVLQEGKQLGFGSTQETLSASLIEKTYGVQMQPNAALKFSLKAAPNYPTKTAKAST